MHHLKLSRQKIIGTLLFFGGIFTLVYSGIKLTGFAVSQSSVQGFFFIGIALVFGGILLMNFSRHSQLEIKIYREPNKNGKGQVYMTDPENFFGKKGTVSLEQFRKDMSEIKKDPALLELIKEAYFVPLMSKYNEGESSESELAKQYLIEMDFKPEEENEPRYVLPKLEIIKIKKAFSERREKITSAQREILNNYHLKYIPNGSRVIIIPERGGERVVIGLSPKDRNAGKRISSLILRLCDKQYREENLRK